MTERVIVRQNDEFGIEFWATDPERPESDDFQPVAHIHQLTPHAMVLVSLGACTGIVLHTYAQNHDVDLKWVEMLMQYVHVSTEEGEPGEEQIAQILTLRGDLDEAERERLFRVSRHCS
ncbi:MAG: OsmC family protein, partial [Anaerolineae bacterium]